MTTQLASTAPVVGLLAGALAIVGIALVVVAFRLLRATRTDHAALGPLEVIGDRSWMRADSDHRAAVLAKARPEGAAPMVAPVPLVVDQQPALVAIGPAEAATEVDSGESRADEPVSEWAAEGGASEAPSLPPIPQPGPLDPQPAPPQPGPLPAPDPAPMPAPDPLPDPSPLPQPGPEPVPEPPPVPTPEPTPAPEPIPDPDPGPIPAIEAVSSNTWSESSGGAEGDSGGGDSGGGDGGDSGRGSSE